MKIYKIAQEDWYNYINARFTKDPEILRKILEKGNYDDTSVNAAHNLNCPPDAKIKWMQIVGKIEKEDPNKHIIEKEEIKPDKDLNKLRDMISSNKNWYKKAYIEGGYWITPSGKLLNINDESHEGFVQTHPKEFNMEPEEANFILNNSGDEDLIRYAVKKGAIHITVLVPHMFIDVNSANQVIKYKEIINQIAKNHGIIPKWKFTTTDDYLTMTREDYRKFTVQITINTNFSSIPIYIPEEN